MPERLPRHPQY